jgi:hypothetical protein
MAVFLPGIYNTHHPVGQNETNQAQDVRLVQTLLIEYARLTPAWKPPSPAIAVDGAYTPALGAWILSFQTFASHQVTIARDGKVHPMKVSNHYDWESRIYGAWSTLYCLNVAVRRKDRAAYMQIRGKLGIAEEAGE